MGVEITRFNIRYKLMVTNLVKYVTIYININHIIVNVNQFTSWHFKANLACLRLLVLPLPGVGYFLFLIKV